MSDAEKIAAWDGLMDLYARWGEVHLDGYNHGGTPWMCASRDAYSRTHTETIGAVGRTPLEAITRARKTPVDLD